MARISALWSEFKAFAFKGNMIDLAVAVVIGAAFSGVIGALVGDIIMPGISYVVSAAKETGEVAAAAADKAKSAAGLGSTQPSTEPTTQPTTQATTAPATEPTTPPAVALAGGPGSASPALLEEIGALKAQVDALKAAAAAPPPAEKKPETKAVEFKWMVGRFAIGHFIGEIINFLLIAAAVFFVIVKLLGSVMKRAGGTPAPSEPTTRECPLCLSVIPLKAKRCAHCAADLPVSS